MKKPFVFLNCAMSVDGKISTFERKQVKISCKEDLARVDRLRAGADAIVVGMKTAVSDDPKLDVKSPALREERKKKGLSENPLKVAVGKVDGLSFDSEFLNFGGKKVLFTTQASDSWKISELKGKAEVYVFEGERVDLADALKVLAGMGVERIMVEGGGMMNFEFLRQGLADEIYVAVGPRIFGGGDSPTMADGAGFTVGEAVDLDFIGAEVLGGCVVLKYSVPGARKYI